MKRRRWNRNRGIQPLQQLGFGPMAATSIQQSETIPHAGNSGGPLNDHLGEFPGTFKSWKS
jgi:hypothetical protein